MDKRPLAALEGFINRATRDESIVKLGRLPDQLALSSSRSLMMFQTHHLSLYPQQAIDLTASVIGFGTEVFINQGQPVTFFFENATKKESTMRSRVNHAHRSGIGVAKHLTRDINVSEVLARQGDGQAAYLYFIQTLYQAMMDRHNTAGKNVNGMFEMMPNIHNVGENTFREANPKQFPVEKAYERTTQIISYIMTRDLCSIAQILNEATHSPNSAFLIIRGTAHLGMAQAMKIMVEKSFPQLSGLVDGVGMRKNMSTIGEEPLMQYPILWSERLWKEVFGKYPELLDLPKTFHSGKDMSQVVSRLRKLLHEEPWHHYLLTMLEQSKNHAKEAPYLPPNILEIVPLTLDGKQFS
jgi:hypothetical protein